MCGACSTDILVGQQICKWRGEYIHWHCRPSGDPNEDAEYYKGLQDGQRYHDEKAIYGPELAEQFAAEDEFNRYWKLGEDY